MTRSRKVRQRHLPSSPFKDSQPEPQPAEHFAVDDRVTHDKYGLGSVIEMHGESMVVDFGSQVRRITIPDPKLGKL